MSKRPPPRNNSGNVVRLFPERSASSPFDRLTAVLVFQQFRDGTLPEGVFLSFMAAAGLPAEFEHE